MAAKTKSVDGQDLHAGDFAWVGDPEDPATWKLPIHDKAHAQNAMARFNQTQGIPADQKKLVAQKIARKAKGFGIDVTDFEKEYCARPSIDELRKALPQRERRYLATGLAEVSLRGAVDESPTIVMHVPFESPSVEMMGFTETIAPGAFARTIKNGSRAKKDDIVSLWNHDPNWVLGRQSNRTLALEEGDAGLDGTVTLDGQDAMHRHFARRVERRDVLGASFGFETLRDRWTYAQDGTASRELLEVRLFDVSPVTFPAYPESAAEARSALDVAATRSGLDVAGLATLLREVERGKVPQAHAAELRRWIGNLDALLPPPPPPEKRGPDYGSKLGLRERIARGAPVKLRKYVRPSDGKGYGSFDECVADNQWHDSPGDYCSAIKLTDEQPGIGPGTEQP